MKVLLCLMMSISLWAQAAPISSNPNFKDVVRALKNPSNPTGFALKSLMESIESQGGVMINKPVITQISNSSYSLYFSYKMKGSESIDVLVNEITLSANRAYVFSFQVERGLVVQKYNRPGNPSFGRTL